MRQSLEDLSMKGGDRKRINTATNESKHYVLIRLGTSYMTEKHQYSILAEKNAQLMASYSSLAEERDRLLNNSASHKDKPCDPGWKQLNCKCYFSISAVTWDEGRQHCKEKGGDLAVINSREEQVLLIEWNMTGWLGLSFCEKEKWKWVDNSPLTVQLWDIGEPDKREGANSYCAGFYANKEKPDQSWHDYPCSRKQWAVCEKFD
ncbi:collectin-12-like isoform X2 [Denticeps clupeoides]|uniref:collectin-12-like isoform X2 n=1 Tax=Denticeps clupeoides TaxID=299321 RepID=UPI0010A3468A|nr:collectin-12-like isoform X2 [Denticeps clupeoides]